MTQDSADSNSWPNDGDDLGFLTNKVGRLLRARMREQLRSQGFDDMDYIVLRGALQYWDRNNVPTTVPVLAEELVLPYEEVSRAAARLIRDNWFVVRATGKPEALEPSAKAVKLAPVLQDSAHWTVEAAMNGFSADEVEALTDMLRRMLRNLE